MEKIDLTRLYRSAYTATSRPEFVTLDDAAIYVGVTGVGDPDGEAFSAAVERLYPVAYAVKAACKQQGRDFGVPKLEGLWWVESDLLWLDVPRSEWRWQLLLRLPSFVDEALVDAAKESVQEKKRLDTADITLVRPREGLCAQVMHTGPFRDEPRTIAALHDFIAESGRTPRGKHHEVYLSDPRKTSPEKMRTILRQPVT